MTEHFDTLETRDPEARELAILAALPAQIAHAKAQAPAFARILADVDPAAVTTRAALAQVPVTRKSELLELQKGARAVRRLRGHAVGRRAGACSRVRVRCTSRKTRPPTTGASRARCSPRASAAASSCTTASRIT